MAPRFIHAFYELDDGTFFVALPDRFREVLHESIDGIRDRIMGEHTSTAALFPSAYPENPDLEDEWKTMMFGQLMEARLSSLEIMEESTGSETLTEDQLVAWMQAINSMRLIIGTDLDISDDDLENGAALDDDDPRTPLYDLYLMLSIVLEEIVHALAR